MGYQLPDYLNALSLSSLPVDYAWDSVIFNTFWSSNDESSPRLAAAINPINSRAAYALGVALSEWIVARVEGHTDTKDGLLRIEAAWAAVSDWRYAKLPAPPPNASTAAKEFVSPLRLAMKLIARDHELYAVSSLDVNSKTQGLAMLADHVVGRHTRFEPWLSESLRRCHEHYLDVGVPVEAQRPVPKEFFAPGFVWRDGIAEESLARFLQTLDPARNPYLRSPEDMLAAGFNGAPYGRGK